MEPRTAQLHRQTKETDIRIELDLDRSETSQIDTGIPFMDHMLTLMTAHGYLDLQIKAKGDTEIDDHHTVEDLGICLGQAIDKALGKREGIRRYGEAAVPMDEALAKVVIDISGRPFLAYRVTFQEAKSGNFDVSLIKEFFRAVAFQAGITLHIDLLSGDEAHHVAESIFKAFGRAMDQASGTEDRLGKEVPSTKGVL